MHMYSFPSVEPYITEHVISKVQYTEHVISKVQYTEQTQNVSSSLFRKSWMLLKIFLVERIVWVLCISFFFCCELKNTRLCTVYKWIAEMENSNIVQWDRSLWNSSGRDGCSYTLFACESISCARMCHNR